MSRGLRSPSGADDGMLMRAVCPLALALAFSAAACAETRGSSWMAEPLAPDGLPTISGREFSPDPARSASAPTTSPPAAEPVVEAKPASESGRALGVFRNTYYDFPAESEFDGAHTSLMSASCQPIADVPRAFYEAVCVQGSGTLTRGVTVSFAKRGCDCADVCPRTGERICFEALDKAKFPWGRGASGHAITPMISLAVDSDVIPLGTPVYIAEYDGVALEEGGSEMHDGCFLAEDRGRRVTENHVDVFTGTRASTTYWNRVLPSNHGVTVSLEVAKCERLRR